MSDGGRDSYKGIRFEVTITTNNSTFSDLEKQFFLGFRMMDGFYQKGNTKMMMRKMSLILVVHYEHFGVRLSADFMDEGDSHSIGHEVYLP